MSMSLPAGFKEEYEKADGDGTGGSGGGDGVQRVEPGVYLAKIVETKIKTINDKKALEIFWGIVSAANGEETGEAGKKTVGVLVWLTEKAMWHLASLLKTLNIIVSDRQVFNEEVLYGRFGCIDVIEEGYTDRNGNLKTKTIANAVLPPMDEGLNKEVRDASLDSWSGMAADEVNDDLPF